MKFEKKYAANKADRIIDKFISRYVDRNKIPGRILLWNSLK